MRREEIESAILAANDDAAVDGIIIYYPVFANQQDQYLRQLVDVSKDVEGLSHRYLFNMYENIRFLDPPACTKKCILPCTPLGIIKILEHLRIYDTALPEGNRLFGRTIGVINRSEVVGRPLAALMANDGASVYSVDLTGIQKFTRGPSLDKPRHEVKDLPADTPEGSLQHILPQCEVVISGVPGDYKVDLGLVRDGAVCINFSTQRNFAPEVKEKASIYVPSTGKATIAILMRNLLVRTAAFSSVGVGVGVGCAALTCNRDSSKTRRRDKTTMYVEGRVLYCSIYIYHQAKCKECTISSHIVPTNSFFDSAAC